MRSVAVARNLRRSDQLKVDTGKTGVISVNHRLIMHGDCIPITPGKPDEGIWLEKRRKGKMSMAEILKSDHTAAEFVFHDVVPRGKYFVVIGSRCAKGDDFRVVRARYEVRVVCQIRSDRICHLNNRRRGIRTASRWGVRTAVAA